MSFEKKESRLPTAWIWIGLILFIGGVILFTAYGMSLGPVSGKHAAWASFGSLLAGFFTIAGTGATIATLLFLAKQSKDMQKVTQAQLDTLTFERYINHRRLFLDQLNELVISNKNTFRFRDPIKLYNSLFPENSHHNCIFKVEPIYDANGVPENHVAEIYYSLDKIKATLGLKELTEVCANNFLVRLYALTHGLLAFELLVEPMDGDVQCGVESCGINIYSLELCVIPTLKIANTLLRFTGNKEVFEGGFNYTSDFVRDVLVRDYVRKDSGYPMVVRRTIQGIPLLAYVYYKVKELKVGPKYIFPEILVLLRSTFNSAESVNELADDAKFSAVVWECIHHLNNIKEPILPGDINFDNAKNIHCTLLQLMSRGGLNF